MTRMLFLLLISVLSTIFFFNPIFAQNSTAKPLPIQVYEKAWGEPNSEVRLKMLKTIWLEESTYIDPAAFAKGPDAVNKMIDAFIKGFPGATLEADPQLSKDNYFTWNWRIFDSKKNLMVAGRDFVELDGKGHILKLVGFWEPENLKYNNLKLVANYFECLFKTQDFKTMTTLIGDGAVYHQAAGLPYGGTYIGFDNWIKMFSHAGSLYDLRIEREPTYFINETMDGVTIGFTINCTSKKTGKVISMPISEYFELKNGKIISIRPFYYDTKGFAEFLQ